MEQSRQEVQSRRMVAILGPLGGLILFGFFRGTMPDLFFGNPEQKFRSLFFGDAEHWPNLVKGFAPLDLAFACFYFWLMCYLMCVKYGEQNSEPKGVKGWLLLAGGVFVGTGAVGGVMGAITGGWYTGLEFFFAMGGLMTVCMVGMLGAAAAVFGIGFMIFTLSRAAWNRVRHRRIAQPIVRFNRYLNAEDVVDEAS